MSPWGVVLARAEAEAEGLMLAELSSDTLTSRRAALGSPRESKPEVYRRPVVTSAASVR